MSPQRRDLVGRAAGPALALVAAAAAAVAAAIAVERLGAGPRDRSRTADRDRLVRRPDLSAPGQVHAWR